MRSRPSPSKRPTTGAICAGDSTINVPSTIGGFAATYGILSIDDELIVYTGKTGTQFTGCQRGAFGTVAASHLTGVPVKANMVSGFITALQSAVAGHRERVRHGGGAQLRSEGRRGHGHRPEDVPGRRGVRLGNKADTGLVRLPNLGAVKWRKEDNSGDLGMALNASNHLAMDAIIDFAAGQTFGAISYPDATTTARASSRSIRSAGWRSRRGWPRWRRPAWGRDIPEGHRGRQGARHGGAQRWLLATSPPTPMWPPTSSPDRCRSRSRRRERPSERAAR